jgi:predicted  nucleic acid-binding Zn-ribbon protein
MKAAIALLLALALPLGARAGAAKVAVRDDRTITKVVKMLEGMLEKSKEDGDRDREIYAKFLCYCNDKKATKTKEISDLAEVIALLESKIAGLKGSNAELSSATADLAAAIAANKAEQEQLTNIRKDEADSYAAFKLDSEAAIAQMHQAIDTLTEIGADQTLGESAADHKQFMAGYALTQNAKKAKAKLSEVLKAAAVYLPAKQANSVQSLLQAPFTGTYTAQSGEVVGILKQMRDTFTDRLTSATAAEEAAIKAYDAIMEAKQKQLEALEADYVLKQAKMGANDGELYARNEQLVEAKEEKEIREAFLEEMIPMCDAKAKEYAERNMMRANEDAAISKAIAILNQDSAFATFGTVDATSTGPTGFLQLRSVRKHAPEQSTRQQVQQLLQAAAKKHKSLRLVKIAALLTNTENPFTAVIEAIDKLVKIIADEGKTDKENLEWCNTERTESDQTIDELDAEILRLEGEIEDLIELIDGPVDGLKAQIAATEIALQENFESQETQTAQRKDANAAYQADIANLVEAESLLDAGINVLTKYYSTIGPDVEMEAPKVLSGETEAVPETFHEEKGYKGQSSNGKEVIEMLTFILDNTKKEEAMAHAMEHEAQHSYEDSMQELKDEEAALSEKLAGLKEVLAEKEKELADCKAQLKAAEEHLAKVKAYLLSIKAGCDFITENIGYRDDRRISETEALEAAKDLLMGTPVYKAAVAEAHLASLGACRDKCVEYGEEHVICLACLAKVEIPGYCAGHPGTEGCKK